jgi:hypothetical protein
MSQRCRHHPNRTLLTRQQDELAREFSRHSAVTAPPVGLDGLRNEQEWNEGIHLPIDIYYQLDRGGVYSRVHQRFV